MSYEYLFDDVDSPGNFDFGPKQRTPSPAPTLESPVPQFNPQAMVSLDSAAKDARKRRVQFETLDRNFKAQEREFFEKRVKPMYQKVAEFPDLKDDSPIEDYYNQIEQGFQSRMAPKEKEGLFDFSSPSPEFLTEQKQAGEQFNQWKLERQKFDRISLQRTKNAVALQQSRNVENAITKKHLSFTDSQFKAAHSHMDEQEALGKKQSKQAQQDIQRRFRNSRDLDPYGRKIDPATGKAFGKPQAKKVPAGFQQVGNLILPNFRRQSSVENMRTRGVVMTDGAGHYNGQPKGLSRAERHLLHAAGLLEEGVTSAIPELGNLTPQQVIEQGGGTDAVRGAGMTKAMKEASIATAKARQRLMKAFTSKDPKEMDRAINIMNISKQAYAEQIGKAEAEGLLEGYLPRAEDPGFFGGLVNAKDRGLLQSDLALEAAQLMSGVGDQDAALLEMAETAKQMSTEQGSGYYEDLKKAWAESEGLMEAFGAAFENPLGVPEMVVESMASFLPTWVKMGAGTAAVGAAVGSIIPVAGTLVGAKLGFTIGGAGAASFALEASGQILESLAEAGVDLDDPEMMSLAWGNDELRGQIKEKALKKGLPVALFDAVAAGMAGRFAVPKSRLMEVGKGQIALRATADLGAQTGAGMSGEVAGQAWSRDPGDPFDYGAIVAEGIMEPFGPGLPGNVIGAYRWATNKDSTTRDKTAPIEFNADSNTQISEGAADATVPGMRRFNITVDAMQDGVLAPQQFDAVAFDTPEQLGGHLADLAGENEAAKEAVTGFVGTLSAALSASGQGPETLQGLKVVDTPSVPMAATDGSMSAGAYDPANDVLYINTQHPSFQSGETNVAEILLHESTHFAERHLFQPGELEEVYGGLSEDQQVEAYVQYKNAAAPQLIEYKALSDDQKLQYRQELATMPEGAARSEWFALQVMRVLKGDEKKMAPGLLERVQQFLEGLRQVVAKYVGTEAVAGADPEAAAQLDQLILDRLALRSQHPAAPAQPQAQLTDATGQQEAAMNQLREMAKDNPKEFKKQAAKAFKSGVAPAMTPEAVEEFVRSSQAEKAKPFAPPPAPAETEVVKEVPKKAKPAEPVITPAAAPEPTGAREARQAEAIPVEAEPISEEPVLEEPFEAPTPPPVVEAELTASIMTPENAGAYIDQLEAKAAEPGSPEINPRIFQIARQRAETLTQARDKLLTSVPDGAGDDPVTQHVAQVDAAVSIVTDVANRAVNAPTSPMTHVESEKIDPSEATLAQRLQLLYRDKGILTPEQVQSLNNFERELEKQYTQRDPGVDQLYINAADYGRAGVEYAEMMRLIHGALSLPVEDVADPLFSKADPVPNEVPPNDDTPIDVTLSGDGMLGAATPNFNLHSALNMPGSQIQQFDTATGMTWGRSQQDAQASYLLGNMAAVTRQSTLSAAKEAFVRFVDTMVASYNILLGDPAWEEEILLRRPANLVERLNAISQLVIPQREGNLIKDERYRLGLRTVDPLARIMSDKYVDWERVSEEMARTKGLEHITGDRDVISKMRVYQGKLGERMTKLQTDLLQPIIDRMTEEQVDQTKLGEYLIARFAPQRNKALFEAETRRLRTELEVLQKVPEAERTEEQQARFTTIAEEILAVPRSGSGVTDTQAAATMTEFARDPKIETYRKLANQVTTLHETTLDLLEQSATITEVERVSMEEAGGAVFERDAEGKVVKRNGKLARVTRMAYVPLRGFIDQESDSRLQRFKDRMTGSDASKRNEGERQSIGRGFNVERISLDYAAGRYDSKGNPIPPNPDTVLANSVQQIMRGAFVLEKSEVDKSLAKFVVDTLNDPKTAEEAAGKYVILPSKMVKRVRDKTGVHFVNVSAAQQVMADDNVVALPRVQLLRDVSEEQLGNLLRPEDLAALKDPEADQTMYIRFKDPNLVKSYKNMGSVEMSRLVQGLRNFSQFLANMSVSWNPAFFMTNFSRDVFTAALQLQEDKTFVKTREVLNPVRLSSIGKQIYKIETRIKAGDSYEAMLGEFRNAEAGTSEASAAAYLRFRQAGGKVSMTGYASTEQVMREIAASMNESRRLDKRILKPLGNWMESVNQGFEGSTRVSFFDSLLNSPEFLGKEAQNVVKSRGKDFTRTQTAVDVEALTPHFGAGNEEAASSLLQALAENPQITDRAGFSQAWASQVSLEAAKKARDITVDFNRKGELGTHLNAFYLFYNASAQGVYRLMRAMGNKRVVGALGGVVAISAMQSVFNRMLAIDDDDVPEYDKLSEFHRDHNLVLMSPFSEGGEHMKIPLPYGYNVFWAIGQRIGDMMYASMNGRPFNSIKAAQSIMDSAEGSLNPFGGGETLLNKISPTLIRPIVELSENKDFMGRPIAPERSPYSVGRSESSRYFSSVSPISKEVAKQWNSFWGGDEVKPSSTLLGHVPFTDVSLTDVSPEYLDYFVSYFGGGLGSEFVKASSVIGAVAEGVLPDPNTTPVFSRFVGQTNDWYNYSRYHELRESALVVKQQLKHYTALKDTAKVRELQRDSKGLLQLSRMVSATDKKLNVLRRKESKLKKNKALSATERESQVGAMTEARNAALLQFLKTAKQNDLL